MPINYGSFRLGESTLQGQEAAANRFRLEEARRETQNRGSLENALRTGTPEAMQAYQQQDPIGAMNLKQSQTESRGKQIERALQENNALYQIISSAQDQPSLDMAIQTAQRMGLDVSRTPRIWGPEAQAYQQQAIKSVLGIKGQLELEHREWEKSFKQKQQTIDDRKARSSEVTALASDKKADAALKLAEGGGKPHAGYRWTPEGDLEPIKGGPADPVNKNQKMTDTERTASGYALRMSKAEKIMSGVPSGDQKPGVGESMAATLPLVGKVLSNKARSDERQKYRQAQEDWVRSKLRKESGAVIADEEMDREIRVYFPQLGDSQAVMDQKANARQVAMEAMIQAAGPAYKPAESAQQRKVVRTGTANGRKVVQYDDGTIDYAD